VRFVPLLALLFLGCTDAVTRKIDEGNRLAKAGKLDDAAGAFEAAAKLPGQSVRARVLLGNVRWAQGKRADAKLAWLDALAVGPTEPDARIAVARAELFDGDAKAAAESADQVLQQLPSRADARLVRAAARLALSKELDGALEDLEVALLDPRGVDSDALYLKGCVLIALKRYSDAQAAFSTLEQRHPRSALSAYGQARLAAAQNHKTDLKAYLFDARSELGDRFEPGKVALDPAFDFVRDDPEFALERRDAGT
jgi:tetratricopeptide (TPR) repeat protein